MSATSYTVIGVANKVAVVAASALLLGGGVSPAGLCALMACLVGCSLYRPAPLRDPEEREALVGKDARPAASST